MTGIIWMMLASTCAGANIHKLMEYKPPIKRLHGRVIDASGEGILLARITVFSNPEVWSDDSLFFEQKRAKQMRVASTSTDEDGRFSLKRLPSGSYEVEFSKDGFNTFSVIVQVGRPSKSEKFCIKLATSDSPEEPYFQPCKRGVTLGGVAQAFDLAGITNIVGAPSFAQLAKGGDSKPRNPKPETRGQTGRSPVLSRRVKQPEFLLVKHDIHSRRGIFRRVGLHRRVAQPLTSQAQSRRWVPRPSRSLRRAGVGNACTTGLTTPPDSETKSPYSSP